MEDFDDDSTLIFRFAISGEVIELAKRPKTVAEAEMLVLIAVLKTKSTAEKVTLLHGNYILRNGYPVLGDADIEVIVK